MRGNNNNCEKNRYNFFYNHLLYFDLYNLNMEYI